MNKKELLLHYKRKFFNDLSKDELTEIKITSKGFQRGREVLIAIKDLDKKIEGSFDKPENKEKIQKNIVEKIEPITVEVKSENIPETILELEKPKRGPPFKKKK